MSVLDKRFVKCVKKYRHELDTNQKYIDKLYQFYLKKLTEKTIETIDRKTGKKLKPTKVIHFAAYFKETKQFEWLFDSNKLFYKTLNKFNKINKYFKNNPILLKTIFLDKIIDKEYDIIPIFIGLFYKNYNLHKIENNEFILYSFVELFFPNTVNIWDMLDEISKIKMKK